jgi:DNA-directed RNA polymerase subunit RPC12/RpoP
MKTNQYKCRDCGEEREPTFKETEFLRRVTCYKCGGTCDPTEATLGRIDKARTKHDQQMTRHFRHNSGF